MNYHENLRNMKRKRMIKILDILEMKNVNSKVLCNELHVSKASVLNYIRELNKLGAEIECMTHEPFNFYLIDKTIVNEFNGVDCIYKCFNLRIYDLLIVSKYIY